MVEHISLSVCYELIETNSEKENKTFVLVGWKAQDLTKTQYLDNELEGFR